MQHQIKYAKQIANSSEFLFVSLEVMIRCRPNRK